MEIAKEMPHDPIIEKSILGAFIIDNTCVRSIIDLLTPDAFYNQDNARIFLAIKQLYSEKTNIDLLTLVSQLKKNNYLQTVGGPIYISKLTDHISSAAGVEYHVRILQQLYYKRLLIKISNKTLVNSYDDSYDFADIVDDLKATLKIIYSGTESNKGINNSDVIDSVINQIKTAIKNNGIIGLSSGIKNLDHAVKGFQGGCVYVIAARPSVGKTSLAKTICINFTNVEKKRGIFFSMEMTPNKLMFGIISEMLSIDNELMKTGKLTAEQFAAIESLKKTFFSQNFIIHDTPALSTDKIRTRIEKELLIGPVEWIAIDYLGLMKATSSLNKQATREQIVSSITADLKTIAKNFNIPVLELVQLSREVEKRGDYRPKLSDLRDSGSIEQDADTVIFVYRPEYHGIKTLSVNGPSSQGFAELILAKNRDGRCFSVPTNFIGKYTSFTNFEEAKELESFEEEQDVF